MGKYLKLARKAAFTAKEANTAKVVSIDTSRPKNMTQAHALPPPAKEIPKESRRRASHEAATKATKAPVSDVPRDRDKSDRSDKRGPSLVPLTVSEVLAEINRWGSGPAKNAELYRCGQLSGEKAVEYVTCAILRRRGSDFAGWRAHAPTVRAALTHGIGCDCEVCR